METNNQLVIIRKIEKYIEYMITILLKLPRTEKFSIWDSVKEIYNIAQNKSIREFKSMKKQNDIAQNQSFVRF